MALVLRYARELPDIFFKLSNTAPQSLTSEDKFESNPNHVKKGGTDMNNIIYIVGLVVVVLFIAGYLGLR
jgi:hypothetical protein